MIREREEEGKTGGEEEEDAHPPSPKKQKPNGKDMEMDMEDIRPFSPPPPSPSSGIELDPTLIKTGWRAADNQDVVVLPVLTERIDSGIKVDRTVYQTEITVPLDPSKPTTTTKPILSLRTFAVRKICAKHLPMDWSQLRGKEGLEEEFRKYMTVDEQIDAFGDAKIFSGMRSHPLLDYFEFDRETHTTGVHTKWNIFNGALMWSRTYRNGYRHGPSIEITREEDSYRIKYEQNHYRGRLVGFSRTSCVDPKGYVFSDVNNHVRTGWIGKPVRELVYLHPTAEELCALSEQQKPRVSWSNLQVPQERIYFWHPSDMDRENSIVLCTIEGKSRTIHWDRPRSMGGFLVHGKQVQYYVSYDGIQGGVKKIAHFFDGVKHGICTKFNFRGHLLNTKYYAAGVRVFLWSDESPPGVRVFTPVAPLDQSLYAFAADPERYFHNVIYEKDLEGPEMFLPPDPQAEYERALQLIQKYIIL